MQMGADAMSDEFFHHAISLRLAIILNRFANIEEAPTHAGACHAEHQRFTSDLHQLCRSRCNLPDGERPCAISEPAIFFRAAVHGNNIPLAQRFPRWNAMDLS